MPAFSMPWFLAWPAKSGKSYRRNQGLKFIGQNTPKGQVIVLETRCNELRRNLEIEFHVKKYDARYKEILDYWNSKKIVTHREGKKGLEQQIKKNLREFTIEEVKQGIDHYAIMYHDETYMYCEYKWTLSRLLQLQNGLAEFLDDGHKWINYCRVKEKQESPKMVEPEPEPEVTPLPGTNTIEELYRMCINALRSMDYKKYIETEHWQHFRKEVLRHFNTTCQLCGADDTTLDVHHKTYVNRGRETFNDVIVLCRHCHDLYHHNKDQCTCSRCLGGEGEHEL